MFEYIRGSLAQKTPAEAVVEAAGVGYAIAIPLSTYEKLPSPGEQVKLLCHHYVREDAEKLYGFYSQLERDIFRQLIGISNIGPKTAIGILSGITPAELVACVNKGDSSRLRKVPGIGDKTAQRLIMELKGKLPSVGVDAGGQASREGPAAPHAENRSQAYAAMVSLGYSEKQVQTAFARVETVIAADSPVEEWIKKALQVI